MYDRNDLIGNDLVVHSRGQVDFVYFANHPKSILYLEKSPYLATNATVNWSEKAKIANESKMNPLPLVGMTLPISKTDLGKVGRARLNLNIFRATSYKGTNLKTGMTNLP